ncbi:hypothetical protein PF010_g24402 [Phytophthora fragariae]|uniref:Uncharacterized protein n=1 Tax=Phytophthora fragariae TaxID=53985 RepID=A0A6A3E2N6_9STRA|nr:hypothetical protein PF003_g38123 [Phytophthora fragariae]KAE8928149.1 hypothetical protein PF009_g21694 [Phytophthora fragariae]KAE9075186.1 hypothetical protein PF010_g24402 [Phytophthora fragariae]KAE9077748.1 hypothetical protein PF007_g24130 [Phytophthora fragariae]KAE9098681.1 hypothetical protein PF006_g23303 [Phytophthora fragariae]
MFTTPQKLLERLTEAEATLESHREVTASLERRLIDTNAEATTARRQLMTDRERLKAGLVAHTAQLDRFRRQLADQDRGQSGVISARIQALQDENNSLRRANSVLRRHSAMHELDVDTLVLASAGISAGEIDWALLGLNPPDVIVGSPQSGGSSSPDEPSTEASSAPVVPRSSPPVSPSSASSSSKRKRDSSPRSSTEGAAASHLPPYKRLGRASVDLRARAAAAVVQQASGSPGDQQPSVASPPPSAALGSPACESAEGSGASPAQVSSSPSASPPSPAVSAPPPASSDDNRSQSSPIWWR